MINRAIAQWRSLRPDLRGVPIAVVLHTSCLNFETESILKLGAMGCRLLLPDNVYWEMKLLTESRSHYRQRAKAIVEYCDTVFRASWDLEQLYAPECGGLYREALYDGVLLFLFGDLNKQDEFLQHVCPLPHSYILINRDWNGGESEVICSLDSVRGCSYRQGECLSRPYQIPDVSRLATVLCVDAHGYRNTSGVEYQWTRQSGRYSMIYSHDAYPDRMFKIYRQCAYMGSSARKLLAMEQYTRQNPIPYAAFPQGLLLLPGKEILGYAMPAFRGRPMGFYCDSGWVGMSGQLGKLIQELLLRLLELHTQGILINDLSLNNVLVSKDGHVFFVDCDSFQFRDYPGGPITEIYRHPEIDQQRSGELLRMPRHEYFALAVLLFQCFLLDDPLFGDGANWSVHRFQLRPSGGQQGEVNAELLENWNDLDPGLRQIFYDIFTFQRDHSIGAWIRALNSDN